MTGADPAPDRAVATLRHDLRTPLTRMRLQLAMLADSAATRNLKSDVDEMEAMVNGYLAFARNQDTEVAVVTDLPKLLDQVVQNARRRRRFIDSHRRNVRSA